MNFTARYAYIIKHARNWTEFHTFNATKIFKTDVLA